MEARDIAILVMILKARQEGVTTLSELILLWMAMFTPGRNVLVGSSRPEKSAEMVLKMELCYANQPYWLVPKIVTKNEEQIGFDDQASFINIRHGAMLSGLGRGGTVTGFHLSEVPEYTNAEESIEASLLRAAHDSSWLLGILEATGSGRAGWWYEKWNYSVQYWPLGQSRLCPIFLPYYALRDIYPTPAWLRARPIPRSWIPLDITTAHAGRANEYVQSGQNQILTKLLGSTWEMPPEVMWFWEVTRNEHKASKTLHKFYAELCADDKEAFQNPNPTVFDAEVLETFRGECRMPKGVYGILDAQGDMPASLQPNRIHIDTNLPPIDLMCKWAPGRPAYEYRLVPLLHHGSGPFDPHGKILIYERPQPGKSYGLGVDTGFGLGQDRSVVEILRKGDSQLRDAQVAEFASPQLNSFNLWPIALALGTYYSTKILGETKQAKIVIEGAANGENVYNELRKRGWRNFHNWVRLDRKRIIESSANRQLWYTTSWSRPLMFDMLLDALNGGWLEINSPWFIEEMADLEIAINQKIAAAISKHDDRIMALGIALFSMHSLETKRIGIWSGTKRIDGEQPRQYAKYSPGSQANVDALLDGDSSLSSYVLRPVRAEDPEAEVLEYAGAGLWTPPNQER